MKLTNKDNKVDTGNIAYSVDALIPGVYFWCSSLRLRLGGCKAESTYPDTIHSSFGFGIVLPGYHIWTSYTGSFDK